MKAKKSFHIMLRVTFLLFSLYFSIEAFYRWDGYSYYMRFTEFLPDLSLAFILWTVIGAVFALAYWIGMYGLFRVVPKSLIPVRLEHITSVFVLIAFVLTLQFVKRAFFSKVYLTNFIHLPISAIMMIAGIFAVVLFWFGRKYAERILLELDYRISPAVWLFVFCFAGAVIVSFFKSTPPEVAYIPGHIEHISRSGKERPNIIVVIMDALTALDVELFGYHRQTTPFISEWANDAIVFRSAYSSSNWTTPCTMSILTGQRPWEHRVWYQVVNHEVSNYEYNLPRVLRDNGYDVYKFVQNHWADPDVLGMKNVFPKPDKPDRFDEEEGSGWFFKLSGSFVTRPIVRKWIFDDNPIAQKIISLSKPQHEGYLSEKIYDSFLRFISKRQSAASNSVQATNPFFAYLHVYPPHNPYLPPKPYMGMFGDAEKFNSAKKQFRNFTFSETYAPEKQKDIDILRKRYDEFIVYSDEKFREFLSNLAGAVDMNNTIIIFSSDHGESFSHNILAHNAPYLYEPLIHVPLVIKIPGMSNGKTIDTAVEQIDIAPTILELAGIPVPEWMEGRSLLPLIEDKQQIPRPVFSMFLQQNRIFDPITKGLIAVREGDYKLIYYLGDKRKLLFDTKSDPDESIDLSEAKPGTAERLMKLIEENLSRVNKKMTRSDN